MYLYNLINVTDLEQHIEIYRKDKCIFNGSVKKFKKIYLLKTEYFDLNKILTLYSKKNIMYITIN